MIGEHDSFCNRCGKQFSTIDEIMNGTCKNCHSLKEEKRKDFSFCCWACEKPLVSMGEVAQGVCDGCKASINRKCHNQFSRGDWIHFLIPKTVSSRNLSLGASL